MNRTVPATTHASSQNQPLFKRTTNTVRTTVSRMDMKTKTSPITTTIGPLFSGVTSWKGGSVPDMLNYPICLKLKSGAMLNKKPHPSSRGFPGCPTYLASIAESMLGTIMYLILPACGSPSWVSRLHLNNCSKMGQGIWNLHDIKSQLRIQTARNQHFLGNPMKKSNYRQT